MLRAIGQLDDRRFIGVLLRCLAWSAAFFIALHVLAVWAVQRVLVLHGVLGWAADVLATIGATIVAMWLFLPVAAAIGTLYVDRIAAAVEHRHYPFLPPARSAPIAAQLADAFALCLRILLLSMLGLALMLILPGIGFILGWTIAAYALGRGVFVAVAMRRMPRRDAMALYERCRWQVLTQGGIMAAMAYFPAVNLLLPILGTAAMVHVLDSALSNMRPSRA